MSRVKKQHLVPRCYLKNFSKDGNRIWLFDKKLARPIESNVNDVATSKYFYDVPKDYLKQGADVQAVEKILSSIERDFNLLLQKVLRNIKTSLTLSQGGQPFLSDQIKYEMASFLALQASRTDEFRRMIVDVNKALVEKIANDFLQDELGEGNAPEALRGEVLQAEIINGHEKAEHARMLGDPDFLESLQNIFFDKIWVIGRNATPQPLFTSDHPVVHYSYEKSQVRGSGYGSPYTEVSYPLDSTFNLMMYDRKTLENAKSLENTVVELDEDNISFYNSLQIKNSTRQIFCRDNELSLASDMLRDAPEMRNVDKSRITMN